MKDSAPVLVVGAGLAGLAAAHRLAARPHVVVEAEASAGGLCRSLRTDGFTFDYTGHLLHMKRPEIRELVLDLVGEPNFLRIDRRSGIYSHGTFTDYPFQVNTHGLPKEVVRECVMGFAEALQAPAALGADPTFLRWALATFGEGICRHFMIPYNQKLLCADLDTVTADWVSWSIPKPSWADVVRGSLGTSSKAFGYNPSFLYPAAGGIDHLPNAFLRRIDPVRLSTSVISVDAARREARLSTGETIRYASMISTMPLPRLLDRIADRPDDLRNAADRLRYVSVLNLNLGFDEPCPVPYHWIYFPEPRFPFYRVGVYSNLCPASVPAGSSSFYVEFSHPPAERLDRNALEERVVGLLREVGLVSETARVRSRAAFEISCAYVIHDSERRAILSRARSFLEHHGILTVGRYGAWEYSAMEDAIAHGREAAQKAVG